MNLSVAAAREVRRPTSSIALAMSALLLSTVVANAETVRATYRVSYTGLPMASFITVTTVTDQQYWTSLKGEVGGVASLVSSFKMNMQASGFYRSGTITPIGFDAAETSSGKPQTMRLSLKGGNVVSSHVEPPLKDISERRPVIDKHRRNVIDPMSALVLPVDAGASGPALCNRVFPTYDGIVRADISLSYLNEERIRTAAYDGLASVCRVRFTPVSGHRPDSTMVRFMADNDKIKVWLARAGTSRLAVPVAVFLPLPLGTISVQLSDLRVDDVMVEVTP